jgi:hypothetical protein
VSEKKLYIVQRLERLEHFLSFVTNCAVTVLGLHRFYTHKNSVFLLFSHDISRVLKAFAKSIEKGLLCVYVWDDGGGKKITTD